MDLVGVASPEPGRAAAWGPSKVSGGRAGVPALVTRAGSLGTLGEGTRAVVGAGPRRLGEGGSEVRLSGCGSGKGRRRLAGAPAGGLGSVLSSPPCFRVSVACICA